MQSHIAFLLHLYCILTQCFNINSDKYRKKHPQGTDIMEKSFIGHFVEKEVEKNGQIYSIISNAILMQLIEAIPSKNTINIGNYDLESPPEVMSKDFSNWVRFVMDKYDYDQSKFANQINFSQGDLSGVLTNRSKRKIGKKKRQRLLVEILNFIKNNKGE